MFQDILAAIPLGIVVAFLFGPVFFVLLETAAIKGARAAIVFNVGVVVADVVFILVAYFSTSKLLERIKDDPALFIFGGFLLMFYGMLTFLKAKKNSAHCIEKTIKKSDTKSWLGLFVKGFLLNFVNIGVLGFWLGLIVAFGPALDMQPERLSVFFIAIIVTYFAVDMAKILLAKSMRHKLTPLRIFKFKRVISVLILLCGFVLFAKGVFPSKLQQIQDKVETVIPDSAKKQISVLQHHSEIN